MSQGRDDAGRYKETVTDQEILKVFDYEDDPVLTAQEVADGLTRFGKQLTTAGVRNRLEQLQGEGIVSRKEFGARAVGWWAKVAPELETKVAREVEDRKRSDEWVEV